VRDRAISHPLSLLGILRGHTRRFRRLVGKKPQVRRKAILVQKERRGDALSVLGVQILLLYLYWAAWITLVRLAGRTWRGFVPDPPIRRNQCMLV
jgi:hypothetical protein